MDDTGHDPTGGITETDALSALRADGFTRAFSIVDGALRCDACHETVSTDDVVVVRALREEGVSNPDDEAIVLGLECPRCGARGTLLAAYGPMASAGEAEVLRRLHDRT